jgi:hypothetical protein
MEETAALVAPPPPPAPLLSGTVPVLFKPAAKEAVYRITENEYQEQLEQQLDAQDSYAMSLCVQRACAFVRTLVFALTARAVQQRRAFSFSRFVSTRGFSLATSEYMHSRIFMLCTCACAAYVCSCGLVALKMCAEILSTNPEPLCDPLSYAKDRGYTNEVSLLCACVIERAGRILLRARSR